MDYLNIMEAKYRFSGQESAREQTTRWRKIIVTLISRAIATGKRMPLGLPNDRLPKVIIVYNLWGKARVSYGEDLLAAQTLVGMRFRTNHTTHQAAIDTLVRHSSNELGGLLLVYSHPMGSMAYPMWELSTLMMDPGERSEHRRGLVDRQLIYSCFDACQRACAPTLTENGTEYIEVPVTGNIDTDLFRVSESEIKSFEASYRAVCLDAPPELPDTITKSTPEDAGTERTLETDGGKKITTENPELQILRGIIHQLRMQERDSLGEIAGLEAERDRMKDTEKEREDLAREKMEKELEQKREALNLKEKKMEEERKSTNDELAKMKRRMAEATSQAANAQSKVKELLAENERLRNTEEKKNTLHNKHVEKITKEKEDLDELYQATLLKHDQDLANTSTPLLDQVRKLQGEVTHEKRKAVEREKAITLLKAQEKSSKATFNEERAKFFSQVSKAQGETQKVEREWVMRSVLVAFRASKEQNAWDTERHLLLKENEAVGEMLEKERSLADQQTKDYEEAVQKIQALELKAMLHDNNNKDDKPAEPRRMTTQCTYVTNELLDKEGFVTSADAQPAAQTTATTHDAPTEDNSQQQQQQQQQSILPPAHLPDPPPAVVTGALPQMQMYRPPTQQPAPLAQTVSPQFDPVEMAIMGATMSVAHLADWLREFSGRSASVEEGAQSMQSMQQQQQLAQQPPPQQQQHPPQGTQYYQNQQFMPPINGYQLSNSAYQTPPPMMPPSQQQHVPFTPQQSSQYNQQRYTRRGGHR